MSDQFESLFPDRFKHDLSPPMSEQDKARKMAEDLMRGHIARLSIGYWNAENRQKDLLNAITNALLQFAQEREGDCAERCNCEDSWPSYSQYPKPSCPIHSKKGAKDE